MRAQGYSGQRNPSDMFSFLNSEHRDGLKVINLYMESFFSELLLSYSNFLARFDRSTDEWGWLAANDAIP